jgi:hypothetical protein
MAADPLQGTGIFKDPKYKSTHQSGVLFRGQDKARINTLGNTPNELEEKSTYVENLQQ